MKNFLKELTSLIRTFFFPSFCVSCHEVIKTSKLFCSICSETRFALWDYDQQCFIIARKKSFFEKLCIEKKNFPFYEACIEAFFLKVLLEIHDDEILVVQDRRFLKFSHIASLFKIRQFDHHFIYKKQNVIFLGWHAKDYHYYHTYFQLSQVTKFRAVFLFD